MDKTPSGETILGICKKCGVTLTQSNYGGYAVNKGVSLCTKHGNQYLELRNRHYQEELNFWKEKDENSTRMPNGFA